MGSKDEYNHSEIYTLLWSIVAHKRLYLKQGLSVELKNILVACTAEHYEDIPPRLRRIMGFVKLQDLQQKDVEQILGPLSRSYTQFSKHKKFDQWLQAAVSQHETRLLRAKQDGQSRYIALPQLLPLLGEINFSVLIKLSKLNMQQDYLMLMLLNFVECSLPFADGRTELEADFKEICQLNVNDNFMTFQKAGTTTQLMMKQLTQQEPLTQQQVQQLSKYEVVSAKVRLNMLKELLSQAGDVYPSLRLLLKALTRMEAAQQQYYLR